MAKTPVPSNPHPPLRTEAEDHPPPAVLGEAKEEKPDSNRVITTGEEQLARSAEMEKVGVRKWMEEHSAKADAPQTTTPGVSPTMIEGQ